MDARKLLREMQASLASPSIVDISKSGVVGRAVDIAPTVLPVGELFDPKPTLVRCHWPLFELFPDSSLTTPAESQLLRFVWHCRVERGDAVRLEGGAS